MIKKETCIGSASADKERMFKYKVFAAAFSYPDNNFFAFFPGIAPEKEKIMLEYDRLFRAECIWLYSAEHVAENEFQRSNYMADIMGFYRAFGVEPDGDRPDSISSEFEFMHYLIFKEINAPDKEKAFISLDSQKKFFREHLYPVANKIAEKIISQTKNAFYLEVAQDMIKFLESEKCVIAE